MTDMLALAHELYERIEWQTVPETVTRDDLAAYIARGIKDLYVKTGRASSFTDNMFVKEDDVYTTFSQTLPLDEQLYV